MAIKFNPECADAYGFRADLYVYIGEYDKAIEGYNMELKFRPDDAEVYFIAAPFTRK